LADGVWAAVHKEGGAAYSNAGIVDLGGRVLLFDTFDMAVAARELRQAILDLTGRAPAWVVNSHEHGDHWGGNQVFADDAILLSTHAARAGMLAWGQEIEESKLNLEQGEKNIRELEAKLEVETDPVRRKALERNLTRERYYHADLPAFRFCPPVQTFDGTLTFHGLKRTVELVATAPGHTPGDCYLALPREKILFTGDLAFFACPPFMARNCDPQGWLDQLQRFKGSKYKTFVPGHGPLGTKQDLAREQEYIVAMQDLVGTAIREGKTLNQVLRFPMPAPFADWAAFSGRQENNLRTLYGQLSKEKPG
jgi:glyoxylase-like metal-dependent hydrolase (beta-lactamase superfamily II)